jgi:hypothetical protein
LKTPYIHLSLPQPLHAPAHPEIKIPSIVYANTPPIFSRTGRSNVELRMVFTQAFFQFILSGKAFLPIAVTAWPKQRITAMFRYPTTAKVMDTGEGEVAGFAFGV